MMKMKPRLMYKKRMDESMLPDYVSTVKALKEEYKGHIHISTGLECEFFPAHMSWLKDTRLGDR